MSGEPNTTRKSPRGNRKAVERVIPIVLTDGNDQTTSEPNKQNQSAVRPTVSVKEDECTPKKLEAKARSAKTPKSVLKATSSSTTTINSSSHENDEPREGGSKTHTSVKQLTFTTPNDNDEEKIKEESVSKFEMPQQLLPPYNVPEKIIIVLDRARDEIFTHFELSGACKFEPLTMLKQGLFQFLNNKNMFDSKHEFALMTLNENSATWLHDFSSDINSILEKFDEIEECETEDIFNMNSVFDLISEKVHVPNVKNCFIMPPPYVVRTVFTYGRSFTMPQIEMTEDVKSLLDSPYFTFDVLMTHEMPDDVSNRCNMIFKKLQELDTKGFAYFFPVSRSSSELYQAMAKLLSHPLQRPTQKMATYKVFVDALMESI